MKKLIFIFSFLLVFASINCQIRPGVIALQKSTAAPCGTMNLVLYSEEMDRVAGNPYTQTDITIVANQANDLNGETTLESFEYYVDHGGAYIYQTVTVTASTTYRLSFEARLGTAGAGDNLRYRILRGDTYATIIAATHYENLLNAVTPIRVSVEFTVPVGCTSVRCYMIDDSTDEHFTGTVFIGRVQIESDGSCYIKTEATHIHP